MYNKNEQVVVKPKAQIGWIVGWYYDEGNVWQVIMGRGCPVIECCDDELEPVKNSRGFWTFSRRAIREGRPGLCFIEHKSPVVGG